MGRKFLIAAVVFIALISGCVDSNQIVPSSSFNNEPLSPDALTPVDTATPAYPNTSATKIKSEFLIDRISENLTSFRDKKWGNLYQADELDCSRMSTYFWDYIRSNYHVAPKVIVSYQRQHAWLALKVSDVGNSTNYRRWNIKGVEYYYLEATIPKIVLDDNQRFVINGIPYTSADFYNAAIYVFDSPQDANDFHADYSMMRGWNQEFRLKKDDMDKIEKFLSLS